MKCTAWHTHKSYSFPEFVTETNHIVFQTEGQNDSPKTFNPQKYKRTRGKMWLGMKSCPSPSNGVDITSLLAQRIDYSNYLQSELK